MIAHIALENISGFRCGVYECNPKITVFRGGPSVTNLNAVVAFAFKAHDVTPELKDKNLPFKIGVRLNNGLFVIRTNKDQGLHKPLPNNKLEKIEWPCDVKEEQFDSFHNWDWAPSGHIRIMNRLAILKDDVYKFIMVHSLDDVKDPDMLIKRVVKAYPIQIITTIRRDIDSKEYVVNA